MNPASIALVMNRGSHGQANEIESALLSGGYRGDFRRVEFDGDPRFDERSMGSPELALVSVSTATAPSVVDGCRRAGCRAVVLLNGPEGDLDASPTPWSVVERGVSERAPLLLGPNSQGVISPRHGLFAGTGSLVRSGRLRDGPIGVANQSGFGHGLVALGDAAGLGFRHVLSTGNEAGLDSVDVVRWLIERPDITLVWLLAEGIRQGRALAEAGVRASELRKAIVVWVTGASVAGRRAAMSHTGALASDHRMLDAALEAGGLIEIHGEDELLDASRVLLAGRLPAGTSVGCVTVSGGAGVALADCLAHAGLDVPAPAPRTVARLTGRIPPGRHVGNPLDVSRSVSGDVDSYRRILSEVARDPRVHQLIAYHGGIDGRAAEGLATAVRAVAEGTSKPISVVWAARPGRADDALAILAEASIPWFRSVHRAANAAGLLARAAAAQRNVRVRPGERDRVGGPIRFARASVTLGERASLERLERYGIPVLRELSLPIVDGLVQPPPAWPLRFPVAVKVDTTDVKSRAAAGLIRLDVATPDEAMRTAGRLASRAARRGASFDGILIQEIAGGLEAYLGAIVDQRFGPVVALGLGGSLVESVSRPIFRLAPLSLASAVAAVRASELSPHLLGRQSAAVADALARLSWLVSDNASWIGHVDVNPLFVSSGGVAAGDAVIVPATVAP